ncbi:MAG: GntR family transcriptional regulator [Pseudomonadota bacterium]
MKQISSKPSSRSQKSKTGTGKKTPPAALTSELADAPTLAEQAYQRIEEQIITLQLAPGTILSENGLSESLEIGRTPIREALQRLAGEGLVQILPKRGVFVTETNIRTQLRLLELRREVQRLLATLAAERASAEEKTGFARIEAGLIRAAEHHDEALFAQLDRELDERMWEAARNEFIVKTMALMRGLSRRFWFEHYRRAGDLPLAATLHAKIAKAIGKGDAKGAAVASDRLIDYIESFSRETIGQ